MGFFSNLVGSFKVDIRCDLNRKVFFPGNIVEGVVIVQARSPIDFRAIRLKLAGKERVVITRTHTSTHRRADGTTETRHHKTHHTSTAVVYKQLVTLAGSMKYTGFGSQGNYFMPNGTFYYPFSIQLPNDLPPSMSHRQGDLSSEIYFYAKAYVDIPMGRDAVSKSFFSIIKPMPLGQWQQRMPVEHEKQFHVTCCCCIDKGYVKARLFMDRSVIAIDRDDINVYAEIDNTLGKEPVRALFVNLRATLNARAQGYSETKVWNQSHAEIHNHIAAGQKGIIQGVIRLRRNAYPTFATPLSSLSYTLMAELDIPMASNPSASFPVIVAQSVDESNYSHPIQFGSNPYRVFNKGEACPEFFYMPPPRPVYEVNTIPMNNMPPPPQQFYLPPPVAVSLGVPSGEWAAEVAPFTPVNANVDQLHHSQSGPAIQWRVGYQQPEMHVSIRDAPRLGAGAPPTPSNEGDAKGYGSIATPLM